MNAPNEPLAAAMAKASYYAKRAGFLEGALLVISWGTSGVDPQEAATRALEAVGEDEMAFQIRESGTYTAEGRYTGRVQDAVTVYIRENATPPAGVLQ